MRVTLGKMMRRYPRWRLLWQSLAFVSLLLSMVMELLWLGLPGCLRLQNKKAAMRREPPHMTT